MAFPEHYLLQWGGDLRGDIFSCGIRFSGSSIPFDVIAGPQQEALTDDMADDITAWMSTSGSGWSSAAKLRYVKFNRITAAGTYHDQAVTHVRHYDTPPYPTAGPDSVQPNQVACVISWVTAAERGRASKGRIFLPVPAMGVDNDNGMWFGPPDTNTPASVATAAKNFLVNLNNQPGLDTPGIVASVVSRVDGTRREITGVRVGSVPDTMRSRRNALEETYSSVSL